MRTRREITTRRQWRRRREMITPASGAAKSIYTKMPRSSGAFFISFSIHCFVG